MNIFRLHSDKGSIKNSGVGFLACSILLLFTILQGMVAPAFADTDADADVDSRETPSASAPEPSSDGSIIIYSGGTRSSQSGPEGTVLRMTRSSSTYFNRVEGIVTCDFLSEPDFGSCSSGSTLICVNGSCSLRITNDLSPGSRTRVRVFAPSVGITTIIINED